MGSAHRAGPAGINWFAIAVQGLVFLARSDGSCCPSAQIACDVQAHAVFLRRIMAQLGRAGIVEAREGREGGYRLARCPEQITLADVYGAVKAIGAGGLNPVDEMSACAREASMRAALDEIAREAEQALLATLSRHTIADLATRTGTPGRSAKEFPQPSPA